MSTDSQRGADFGGLYTLKDLNKSYKKFQLKNINLLLERVNNGVWPF